MFRKCTSLLCWLTVWSCACVALGQNNPYRYVPYNPFYSMGGPAGTKLGEYYNQAARPSTSGANLNEIALRNAQSIMANSAPQPSSMGAARIGLGLGGLTGNKPFSSYTPAPTVSPYLNLFREDRRGGTAFNYSTLVQPQLQQQQLNQQLERQQYQTARRLQSIAAQSEYNPEGAKDLYPTGHQTVYMYYGHYYTMQRHQRRRQ